MSGADLDFVIRAGCFDGNYSYDNFEELQKDFVNLKVCNVSPEELMRCVAIAYELGRRAAKEEKEC